MTRRPQELPDFKRPPLSEVALSLQFDTVDAFSIIHFGLLWEEFRSSFPLVSEHAPLVAAYERFGVQRSAEVNPIELLSTLPKPRVWFTNKENTEIVQFQTDRIVHNWKKIGEGSSYPRYEYIVGKFKEEVSGLNQFLARNNLGNVKPNQCEVTYVNDIFESQIGFDPIVNFGKIFSFWRDLPSVPNLGAGEFESGRTQLSLVLKRADGAPFARLHVDVIPVSRTLESGIARGIRLTLTARGRPVEGSIDGAFVSLDELRFAVVSSFARLTTNEVHKIWARTDA